MFSKSKIFEYEDNSYYSQNGFDSINISLLEFDVFKNHNSPIIDFSNNESLNEDIYYIEANEEKSTKAKIFF